MKQRIITSIGLIFIIGSFYFLGDYYYLFQIGLSIIAILGMMELLAIAQNNKRFAEDDQVLTGCAYVIVALLPWVFLFWFARLLVLVANIILLLSFIISKKNNVERLAYLYLLFAIFGTFLIAINYFYLSNKYYIAFFMFVAFGSDTFAYFIGYFFGKHQLIPWVSPKKTIEGSIGGLLGAVITVFFMQAMYTYFVPAQIPAVVDIFVRTPYCVMMIIVLAAFSQCGDLFFSKIKRYFARKDYGNIFPGHGGLIDRSDSLIFVTIIFSLFYSLLH